MKNDIKKYISHWAFLPLDKFNNEDSIKILRKDFGECSKCGMITDAIFPMIINDLDEIDELDCVNDFYDYFIKNGITKLNDSPEGY